MLSRGAGFDLDLTTMDDVALVILAVDARLTPARDVLLLRYNEVKDDLIAGLAWRLGWRGDDVRDAQQEAVIWMIEAFDRYDTSRLIADDGRGFRSFLYGVLVTRFSNYARGRRRHARHFDRATQLATDAAEDATVDDRRDARRRVTPVAPQGSPGDVVEMRETMERLNGAIARLEPTDRRILELVTSGKKYREEAEELDLTPAVVNHRWREVRRRLRELPIPIRVRCRREYESQIGGDRKRQHSPRGFR